MRRKYACLAAILVLILAVAGCGEKKSEGVTHESTVTESVPGISEDGGVKVERNKDGSLTVEIALAENSNKDISVVVAKDRETASSVKNGDTAVLAVEQITLDAGGKGSVTLKPSENVSCFVSVNGKHIVEVKG